MLLASAPASPWVRGVITTVIYTAAGLAAVAWTSSGDVISQLYLAAGFGLACVLGWGRSMAWAVGVGSALVSLLSTLWLFPSPFSLAEWASFIISGVGGGLQALAAARWSQGPDERSPLPLDRPADIGRFLLVAGPLACVISSGLNATGLVLLGLIPNTEWLPTLASWWAGDTLGVLIGTPMLLTLMGHPTRLWQQRRRIVGLPLAVAALLMGLGIQQIQVREQERELAAFRQHAQATANGVRLRLNDYIAALESMRGVFDASDTVERSEFRRASLHWLHHLEGVQALGWEERLHISRLDDFERSQRAEGLTSYRVFDMPGRSRPKDPELLAMRFVEPLQGNESLLGLNVLSRDLNRQAYEQAVRSNEPVATAGIVLRPEGDKQLGVVIYRPVYRNPGETVAERTSNVQGAVSLALRMDDALANLLKGIPAFMHACLLDTTQQPAQLLSGDASCSRTEGHRANAASTQFHAVVLPFAQREWTLQLWADGGVPVPGGRATSWMFVVGGVAFAAALGALLLVVTGQTDRMAAAIDEARQQRQAAELANQAKSEFLSRMSHELRTPLNAMLGFAQVIGLDQQHPLPATQQSRVDQIQQAGWHLLDMIDDVLDLSRIDTGTLRLDTQPLALAGVLETTQNLVADLAQQKQVTLSVDGTLPALWGVQADETRLRQIITNLLSNAIKYNRPGGSVHVQAALVRSPDHPPMIDIAITDTGLGMSPAQQAQLFQPFNRLGRERGSPDGTGIGLVISRHLAQLMGGQLEVISTEGEGSTFTLTLPATPLRPPAEVEAPPLAAETNPLEQPRPQRHVLYVEDNDANTAVVQDALASRPWIKLSVAATIEEGLAAVHDRVRGPLPELILLDVHLPDASGLDFLNLVKANPATQHIPVVMISADAMPEQVDACLRAGAACYLTKPLQISALLQQTDDLLAQASSR